MSEKRFRYTFKFNLTHNIAQIYQDNVLICEDILIDEKTLDFLIDTLNGLSEQKRFYEEMAHNLKNENGQLRKKIFWGFLSNCTLENENDILHLQYIFALCKLLVDDAVEEVGNGDIKYALELADDSIYQFENRMKHFNQDKNGEKRVFL